MFQENTMGSNCNVFYRCLGSKKIQWDLTVTYLIDVYVPRKWAPTVTYSIDVYVPRKYNGI